MSSFNSSFFKKSYQKSLVQANRSLCIALVFGILGLLFFVVALSAVYFARKKENFTTISEDIGSVITQLDDLSKEEESDSFAGLSNDLSKLNNLSSDIKTELAALNTNFIIVSLVGGSFIELIAVINFYQYGKAVSQISDRLDRNQRFILANSICEEFEGERQQEARHELMKKIIADVKFASQDNQSAKTTNHDRDNSNGGKKSNTVPQK